MKIKQWQCPIYEIKGTIHFVGRLGRKFPFAGLPGGDIPITTYTEKELEQLMGEGLKLLHKAGFSPIKYFRGGGWVSGEKVFRNLLKFGIKNDSSPVPYKFVSRLHPDTPPGKIGGTHMVPYRVPQRTLQAEGGRGFYQYLSRQYLPGRLPG